MKLCATTLIMVIVLSCNGRMSTKDMNNGSMTEAIEMLEASFLAPTNKVFIKEKMDLLFALYNVDHIRNNYLLIGNKLVQLRKNSKGNYTEMDLIQIMINSIPDILSATQHGSYKNSINKKLQELETAIHIPPYLPKIAYSPLVATKVKRPLINAIPLPFKYQNILFDFNNYSLHVGNKIKLNKVQSYLTKNKAVLLEIAGFTDTIGSDKYNLNLSEKRAITTANYLIKKGVYQKRLKLYAFGEKSKNNKLYLDPKQQRRVEFSDKRKYSKSEKENLIYINKKTSNTDIALVKELEINKPKKTIIYKIQIGAFKNPKKFKTARLSKFGIIGKKTIANLTFITIGSFTSLQEAQTIKGQILDYGSSGAFITAEKCGERLYLTDLNKTSSVASLN